MGEVSRTVDLFPLSRKYCDGNKIDPTAEGPK